MLWRRCSNVVETSWQHRRATWSQHRKLTSAQLSFSTVPQRCDNVNNDVVTTLSQCRCASWVIGIRSFDSKLLDCIDYNLTQTLLFDISSQTSSNNFKIINTSIDYILSSKRFDEPLFHINYLISKSEFRKQFYFFIDYYYFIYFIYLFIYFSYFILPVTLEFLCFWRHCNFVFVCVFLVHVLHEVKCLYI